MGIKECLFGWVSSGDLFSQRECVCFWGKMREKNPTKSLLKVVKEKKMLCKL